MKTINKTLTFYENLIIQNIDFEGYGINNDCYMYDKIKTLYNIFISEYGREVKRYGEKRAFTEWLQGLPSSCTVPFYNSDILNRAYLHGLIEANATEEQEDNFLENYWGKLSLAFFTLKENL